MRNNNVVYDKVVVMSCILKILITLSLQLYLSEISCAQSSVNCIKRIKTGKFEQIGSKSTSIVIRKKRKQIEKFNDGESKFISTVYWIDDKKNKLKVKKCINCEEGSIPIGTELIVEIIDCGDDWYLCRVEYKTEQFFEARYRIIENLE